MRLFFSVLAAFVSFASLAGASNVDPVQQHNSNAVWFENWVGLQNATLTVAAPNGKLTSVFAKSGTPVYELERGQALDGVYRYELSASTDEKEEIVNAVNNGRDSVATSQNKPFHMSGSFVVSRGVIITPEEIKEE